MQQVHFNNLYINIFIGLEIVRKMHISSCKYLGSILGTENL